VIDHGVGCLAADVDDLLQIRIDILLLHGQAYVKQQHLAMAKEALICLVSHRRVRCAHPKEQATY
jgi:hypothetical protein